MKNRLFIPGSEKDIEAICKNGFNSLILPVENMSIGFDCYFSIDKINELSKKHDIYLMVNRFFDVTNIDESIKILNEIKDIKGIFVEDLGLFTKLNHENKILYQNHLNMNYLSINEFYKLGYKNVVISNELTIDEIKTIRKETKSELYYFAFSKNILMYTRRNLLTNYYKYFKKNNKNKRAKIKETVSNYPLEVMEEDYGTAIINDVIFSCNSLIDEIKENIDYLIYNFTGISDKEKEILLKDIDDKKLSEKIDVTDYFLLNDIFYKVKDVG